MKLDIPKHIVDEATKLAEPEKLGPALMITFGLKKQLADDLASFMAGWLCRSLEKKEIRERAN